ncbi:unnamed protein product [Soboliphyme baturini]|uniref:Secreted protein n=1 Tax=Soboliphyme baturini TaxID=241478 RepID=A0A183ITL7_9BILA|nr:unnamed protein product [Soboliphyme baturini]
MYKVFIRIIVSSVWKDLALTIVRNKLVFIQGTFFNQRHVFQQTTEKGNEYHVLQLHRSWSQVPMRGFVTEQQFLKLVTFFRCIATVGHHTDLVIDRVKQGPRSLLGTQAGCEKLARGTCSPLPPAENMAHHDSGVLLFDLFSSAATPQTQFDVQPLFSSAYPLLLLMTNSVVIGSAQRFVDIRMDVCCQRRPLMYFTPYNIENGFRGNVRQHHGCHR